jgi:hypothetical protein
MHHKTPYNNQQPCLALTGTPISTTQNPSLRTASDGTPTTQHGQ